MSLPRLRRPIKSPICTHCIRTFTTTTISRAAITTKFPTLTPADDETPAAIPPYPYGPAQWYKQSDRGLYGGQRIQFGNNIGPKSGVKTRRSWGINVFNKRLWSKALNSFVRLRVSKKVLRTVDKVGGLDEYLLGEKEGRIKGLGLKGWELRWAVMQSFAVKRRFRAERQALGVEELEEEVERLEEAKRVAEGIEEVLGEEAAEEDAAGTAEGEAEVMTAQKPYPKVRVARNKHLVLTRQGFQRRVPVAKPPVESRLQRQILRDKLRPRLQAARSELETETSRLQTESVESEGSFRALKPTERRRVLADAKRELMKELEENGEVEKEVKRRMNMRERQIGVTDARRERKWEKHRAWRERERKRELKRERAREREREKMGKSLVE